MSDQKEYSKKDVVGFFEYFKERDLLSGVFDVNFQSLLKEKGLIEEEFEEGKVYGCISIDCIFKVVRLFGDQVYAYGFIRGLWFNECDIMDQHHEITSKDTYEFSVRKWEEALIKEGDKYIGKTVKCLYSGEDRIVHSFSEISSGNLWYRTNDVKYGNIKLMENGKWSEIVEEKDPKNYKGMWPEMFELQKNREEIKKQLFNLIEKL